MRSMKTVRSTTTRLILLAVGAIPGGDGGGETVAVIAARVAKVCVAKLVYGGLCVPNAFYGKQFSENAHCRTTVVTAEVNSILHSTLYTGCFRNGHRHITQLEVSNLHLHGSRPQAAPLALPSVLHLSVIAKYIALFLSSLV